MLKEVVPNLDQLTPADKLLLLEELWDNLAIQPADIPVPQWHQQELETRYQEYMKDPTGSSWSDVRQRIMKSLQ
jgi:putative addiction module component (TIGR02574 family)